MTKKTASLIRLGKITITNFKGIDSLELHFPVPFLPGTADALVIGSKNGVGKTSVLEACALLLMVAPFGEKISGILQGPELPFDIGDYFVRVGEKSAVIEGVFSVNGHETTVTVLLTAEKQLHVTGKIEFPQPVSGDEQPYIDVFNEVYFLFDGFFADLVGITPNPVFLPSLLYFHSNRKVKEAHIALSSLVDSEAHHKRSLSNISAFKKDILSAMMSKAELFENTDSMEGEESLQILSGLIKHYASAEVSKFRLFPYNNASLRITKTNSNGKSISFDGLSSGQKEIISTLYLIWNHTRNNPSIVLIDEPELHLNAEWHGDLIRQLHLLAPHNQYIIATHSERIAASVPEEQRALLSASEEEA